MSASGHRRCSAVGCYMNYLSLIGCGDLSGQDSSSSESEVEPPTASLSQRGISRASEGNLRQGATVSEASTAGVLKREVCLPWCLIFARDQDSGSSVDSEAHGLSNESDANTRI